MLFQDQTRRDSFIFSIADHQESPTNLNELRPPLMRVFRGPHSEAHAPACAWENDETVSGYRSSSQAPGEGANLGYENFLSSKDPATPPEPRYFLSSFRASSGQHTSEGPNVGKVELSHPAQRRGCNCRRGDLFPLSQAMHGVLVDMLSDSTGALSR
jgi:hypothetical protein